MDQVLVRRHRPKITVALAAGAVAVAALAVVPNLNPDAKAADGACVLNARETTEQRLATDATVAAGAATNAANDYNAKVDAHKAALLLKSQADTEATQAQRDLAAATKAVDDAKRDLATKSSTRATKVKQRATAQKALTKAKAVKVRKGSKAAAAKKKRVAAASVRLKNAKTAVVKADSARVKSNTNLTARKASLSVAKTLSTDALDAQKVAADEVTAANEAVSISNGGRLKADRALATARQAQVNFVNTWRADAVKFATVNINTPAGTKNAKNVVTNLCDDGADYVLLQSANKWRVKTSVNARQRGVQDDPMSERGQTASVWRVPTSGSWNPNGTVSNPTVKHVTNALGKEKTPNVFLSWFDTNVNQVPTRVFNVQMPESAYPQTYSATLKIVQAYVKARPMGSLWIVGGDFNGNLAKAARSLGGASVTVGQAESGFVLSPGLKLVGKGINQYGKTVKQTKKSAITMRVTATKAVAKLSSLEGARATPLQVNTIATSVSAGSAQQAAQAKAAREKAAKAKAAKAKAAKAAAPIKYKKPSGSMYHVPSGTPYRVGNSPTGINRAVAGKFKQIDIDLQMTKDRVVVATHWHAPMKFDGFYDPEGKLSSGRTVDSMTWKQVSRLRSRDGYRIQRIEDIIALMAKKNLDGSFEVKQDTRFANVQVMKALKAATDKHRVNVHIKQIPSISRKHAETLAAARKAGFWTRNAGVPNQDWRAPN